jgi:FtsH-binding integral membrane protein
MTDIEPTNNLLYKKTLKYLVVTLLFSTVITTLIVILANEHDRHSIIVIILNIAAAFATSLGMIAIFRYRLNESHGKSYLFLTLGIALWFFADLNLLYLYFVEGIVEQKQISISDIFWFSGYVFLSLHLVSVMRTIHIKKISKTLAILLVIVIIFVIVNLINSSTHSLFINDVDQDWIQNEFGVTNLIVTILYPILDLSLIIPSVIILLNIYHEYQHSIPWILSSVSLLANAIADNGYVDDFIRGSSTIWIWDLFYINDFIIMAAALYWINKFHITDSLRKRKIQK